MRDIRPTLYLLWGGVLLVLLVGGVNITNLMLVRRVGRSASWRRDTRSARSCRVWRASC